MQISGYDCDTLNQAVHRYYKLIFSPARGKKRQNDARADRKVQQTDNFAGYLDRISIELHQPCDVYPSYKADENCEYIAVKVASIRHQ